MNPLQYLLFDLLAQESPTFWSQMTLCVYVYIMYECSVKKADIGKICSRILQWEYNFAFKRSETNEMVLISPFTTLQSSNYPRKFTIVFFWRDANFTKQAL